MKGKIKYSQEFKSDFGNRWIGIEIEVNDGEGWDEKFADALEIVNRWGSDNNNKSFWEKVVWLDAGHPTTPTSAIPVYDKKSEETEIAIDNATSLHELDLLMGDAAKYGLAKQLNEKRNKLKEI